MTAPAPEPTPTPSVPWWIDDLRESLLKSAVGFLFGNVAATFTPTGKYAREAIFPRQATIQGVILQEEHPARGLLLKLNRGNYHDDTDGAGGY